MGKGDNRGAVRRLIADGGYRAAVMMRLSLAANVIYGVFEAQLARTLHNPWFAALAFYYLVLALMRLSLVRLQEREESLDRASIRNTLIQMGVSLLVLSIAVAGISYLVNVRGDHKSYPGVTIYAAALFSFICLGAAVVNAIRARRNRESEIQWTVRVVSLASALVSLYQLQVSILANMGGDPLFAARLNIVTGAVVFLAVVAEAVFLIRMARRMR